jgi:sensor c-di-GMP phosphodiesterase-like protein
MMLAKELKMGIIAEGIETVEQVEYLKTLNCQFGQGNLFSKPLYAEGVTALLEYKV